VTKIAGVERRLVAIFAADVEGYSRLMGNDEVATLRDLTERRQILDGLIASHRGRIANTAGDSVLAEFASAVDAVQCAIEAQAAWVEANDQVTPDRHIKFRIGVHVGDVMVRAGDLFGDGVNIAARLQSSAAANGISISGAAHEQVKKILPLTFVDLGIQSLRNIDPIRAYGVSAAGGPSQATWLAGAQKPLALPDKPSIAVLPFQNMSGDPEQEYFADGMVEDIIAGLSRFKSLFVIARHSTFTYKGRAVDIKQVGRELGVRYVLEGSVRKSGTRVRIAGQLVDSASGMHLWADRFDGRFEDVFDLQDQVTTSVVGAITPKLEQAEIERAKRKPTASLDAYDYYLQGMAKFYRWTAEDNSEALRLFKRSIELDPEFASAYGMAARCYSYRRSNKWFTDLQQETVEAARLARYAVQLGKDDAVALCLAGWTFAHVAGDLDSGASLIDQSITLNSNLAVAWLFSGWVAVYLGEPEVAIERVGRAMRLSPLDPSIARMQAATATAHFFAGRYDEACSWAEKAVRGQPDSLAALRVAAASSALAGRLEKAREAMARLLQLDPTARASNLKDYIPLRRPEDFDSFAEGLRMAGLPE
jgi:TolB-like protein/class 3 adenylate cyclase/tetratricopeptide (TPR) repeat protein